MEWLRIDTATIKGPEFIGATPVQRATWLCLLNYCVEQENSGVIEDCGEWGSRHWMQSCGVMMEEIEDNCGLWSLEGDEGQPRYLVVAFYPIQDQEKCIKLRKRAKEAGLASAKARAKAKADGQANGQPKGSTEERRGEETRGEEEDTSSTSNPPPPPQSIDFFKGKDCYIGDDHLWFDGCYDKFAMDFLHLCINECSNARDKKGLKPMVCMSDLKIMIKQQYKKYGETALRVEHVQR